MYDMRSDRPESTGSVYFQEFDDKQVTDDLHEHDSFELVFVTKGSGEWQMGASTGRFRAGALFICPPKVLHAWRSERAGGTVSRVSAIVLRFGRDVLPVELLAVEEMEALKGFREAFGKPLRIEVSDRERMRARLRSVERAKGVLRLARFYVALDLAAGFERTQIVDVERDAFGNTSRDAARLDRIRQWVSSGFSGELSRAEAAGIVGLDEASFSRFFRRATGTTFVDYVSSLRVRHAAALLGSRRDLSMGEVCEQSGFGSLASLHRQFKRRLGTTPDSYRKAANSEMLAP